MVEFSLPPAQIVNLVVAVVLPLLVALVTTRTTNSAIKGLLLAALSVATGVLTELGNALATGASYDIGVGLLNALMALTAGQVVYQSVFKPTGLAAKLQDVGVKAEPTVNTNEGTAETGTVN